MIVRHVWCKIPIVALLASCASAEKCNVDPIMSIPQITSQDAIKRYNGQRCLVLGHLEVGSAKNDLHFVTPFGRFPITDHVKASLLQQPGPPDRLFVVTARYIKKQPNQNMIRLSTVDYFGDQSCLYYFTDVDIMVTNE